MKKILLIISLVAFFAIGGSAQSKSTAFGIKFGPSFDWASSGSTAANSGKLGMGCNLGLVIDHYYSSNFAISSGLNFNYLRMNYQFTDIRRIQDFLEEVLVSVNRKVKGSYFEVPIKAKVKIDIIDSWAAFVEAGVGLSFNMADMVKDKYTYKWVSYADETFQDYRSYYSWFQASINFGVGAEFEVNRNLSLFAQLTFNHALTNTFSKQIEKLTGSVLNTNFIGIEVGFLL